MSAEPKKVCLVMPGYSSITGGAARGFYRASARHMVATKEREGSLLAHNFNWLWCWALGCQQRFGCDYFAMIHADIGPDEGWLDVLIDELEARDLDVLGVVAPIKDDRGVTSIAVGNEPIDPWKIRGRLTMSEVMSLPETFTSADVGGPLLLNTGLWVCRFGEWAKAAYFTINDRIVVDEDGDHQPEVEPEDWFFSRRLHEMGLKVGCTRKVKLSHRGSVEFPNDKAWGTQTFDRHHRTEPLVPVPEIRP